MNQNTTYNDYTEYIDNLVIIYDNFLKHEEYYKYSIISCEQDTLNNITPRISDTWFIYYKDLHKFYEQIIDLPCDYGFGKSILKKAKAQTKKDNTNYIDITTLRRFL